MNPRKPRNRRSLRRRGILLMEILVALLLTSLFLLVFLPLWNATWRAHKDSAVAIESIFRAEAAATQLRGDAWAATDATVAADGSLGLAGEPAVRWFFTTDAEHDEVLLTREAAGDARTFRVADPAADPPAFAVEHGTVFLSLAGRRLACPAPLLGGSR